ncbi:MAG: type II toxin-antitoxin system HicA family toxin [Azoarcus sp.]|nr:type II toxin-antitoxin system HicA family toxin [Azoarcus sp.]
MHGYYERVAVRLKQAGYSFLRGGKGSHEIWTNGIRNQTVSHNMPSRHMANEIMKQAGIGCRF